MTDILTPTVPANQAQTGPKFHIVPIERGPDTKKWKAPQARGWNSDEQARQYPDTLYDGYNGGICHKQSGTCAIDIDQLDMAKLWFAGHGIDFKKYLTDPSMVRIVSGRDNREKLIFRLPPEMIVFSSYPIRYSEKANGKDMVDFRCVSATGNTQQDVFPGSIHPETHQPYQWEGDPSNIPVIPSELLTLWQNLNEAKYQGKSERPTQGIPFTQEEYSKIQRALSVIVDGEGYDTWLAVGMGLWMTGWDCGFELWDAWALKNCENYDYEEMADKWYEGKIGEGNRDHTYIYYLANLQDPSKQWQRIPANEMFNVVQQPVFDVVQVSPSFPFSCISDEFDKVRPRADIIHGYLPDKALVHVYGDSQSYKTFWTLNMAAHIVTEIDYVGRKVVKGGDVFIVAGEGSEGLKRRMMAWQIHHGIKLNRLGNRIYASELPVDLSTGFAEPNVTTTVDHLYNEICNSGIKPVALIFDTLATNMSGDGNQSKDFNFVTQVCRQLINRLQCSVVLIDHTNHTEKTRAGGTYQKIGNVDYSMLVQRKVNPANEELLMSTSVIYQKAKEGGVPELGDEFQANIVDLGIVDIMGEPVTSLALSHSGDAVRDRRNTGKQENKNERKNRMAMEHLMFIVRKFCESRPRAPVVEIDADEVFDWRKNSSPYSEKSYGKRDGFRNGLKRLAEKKKLEVVVDEEAIEHYVRIKIPFSVLAELPEEDVETDV